MDNAPRVMTHRKHLGSKLALASALLGAALMTASGCSEDTESADGGAGGGAAAGGGDSSVPEASCETLFGQPTENTGLSEEQCVPVCATCEESGQEAFAPPRYGSAEVEALLAWTDVEPPALLESNPYEEELPEATPGEVCAVVPVAEGEYRTETFDSADSAEAAQAWVTHAGACGQCSSLQDLAVYMEFGELTDPVRRCSVQNLDGNIEDLSACIQQIGFSEPCAQIWAYNSVNTGELCRDICLSLFSAPHHNEDGSLNECIQCDEDNSGPVFKAVSGRTRRNSGLPSAICRPCDTVAPIVHDYALAAP